MFPLIIRMSVPAVCANIVNALYNLADRFFVGQYIGTDALGGVGLVFPLNNITSALTVMLVIGGSALMSRALGKKDGESADASFTNMMVLAFVMAFVLSFLFRTFTGFFVSLCGGIRNTPLFAMGYSYLKITSVGMFFMVINLSMAAAVRAEGNTDYAMVITVTGAFLNILLDYVMVVMLGRGLEGAALATVASQITGCALGFLYFLQGRSTIKWTGRKDIHPERMKTVLLLGSAPAVFQGLSFVNNILINHNLMSYGNGELGSGGGERTIAAVSVIMSLENLAIMFIMGMNNALSVIIGFNYGGEDFRRVRSASFIGQLIASVITLALWIVLMLFPRQIFLLFNSHDPALAEYGIRAVRKGKIFLFSLGFQTLASMYYSAIGRPGKATMISLSRNGLFLIPALLILPRFFGLNGVLYSSSVSDGCSLVLVGILYVFGLKELKRREGVW